MIKKLRSEEIDIAKYDACLENSVQRNFYAKRKILDELTERWELLVFGDYYFLMPVPLKRKLGLDFVLMPLFCQQLGVFGPHKSGEVEEQFHQFLVQNYRVYTYSFNKDNLPTSSLALKKNYFISSRPFADLYRKYSKGRKSAIKSAPQFIIASPTKRDTDKFIRAHAKGLSKKKDLEKFNNYLVFLSDENLLRIYTASHGDCLHSAALLIEDNETLHLLALVTDESRRQENSASFLIHHILREKIGTRHFNFMGGNIRGIEVFFKSFGAENVPYPTLQNSRTNLLQKLSCL